MSPPPPHTHCYELLTFHACIITTHVVMIHIWEISLCLCESDQKDFTMYIQL